MNDNAGDHDTPSTEVHPDPPVEVQADGSKEESSSPTKGVEDVGKTAEPPTDDAGPSSPPPPPSEAPPAPPPAETEPSNVAEALFLPADDEEGLDPDTLANLAALSRLARDEGDEEEDGDGEGGAGGDNDFSTLMADSQHSMTREQMQEIVARLAQHKDDDGDLDADGEDEMDAEGEDDDGRDEQGDQHNKREASEDLREVDEDEKRKGEKGGLDTKPAGRGQKRKRNRTVL